MALTVSQKPPLVLLSEQPAVFRITTDYTDPLRVIGRVTGETGDSLIPDSNHQVQFELSDYLKGRITQRGKTGDLPQAYSSNPLALSFTFEEYYAGQVQASVVSDTFYLLDGKVPQRLRKAFYQANASLFAYLVSSKSCLSWWPTSLAKRVLPGQKEFLNYLQLQSQDPVNLKLMVTLLLDDGSVQAGPVQAAINNVSYASLVYFPCGYTQLGIPAFMETNFPGKKVEQYTVAVFSGSTPYSQIYNFLVDAAYYFSTRELWVKNPFGLYEVLLCRGKAEQNTLNKGENAITDGISLPSQITWRNTRSETVKVSTGLISQQQAQWLSDLLDTTEACELRAGTLHPVILRDSTITHSHDGDFLFEAELEYEYAPELNIETA